MADFVIDATELNTAISESPIVFNASVQELAATIINNEIIAVIEHTELNFTIQSASLNFQIVQNPITFIIDLSSGGGGGAVDSVNGQTGVVVLDKSDIGLGAVDNTSDLEKPISSDTQAVLDEKQDILPDFTAGYTLIGDGTNVPVSSAFVSINEALKQLNIINSGISNTSTVGLGLRNLTAATNSIRAQRSPALEFEGNGWSASSTNLNYKWRMELTPQTYGINCSILDFSAKNGSGGYSSKLQLDSLGAMALNANASIVNGTFFLKTVQNNVRGLVLQGQFAQTANLAEYRDYLGNYTSWVDPYGFLCGVPDVSRSGSILFCTDGDFRYSYDSNHLYYDGINRRLGFGTNTPSYGVDFIGKSIMFQSEFGGIDGFNCKSIKSERVFLNVDFNYENVLIGDLSLLSKNLEHCVLNLNPLEKGFMMPRLLDGTIAGLAALPLNADYNSMLAFNTDYNYFNYYIDGIGWKKLRDINDVFALGDVTNTTTPSDPVNPNAWIDVIVGGTTYQQALYL